MTPAQSPYADMLAHLHINGDWSIAQIAAHYQETTEYVLECVDYFIEHPLWQE